MHSSPTMHTHHISASSNPLTDIQSPKKKNMKKRGGDWALKRMYKQVLFSAIRMPEATDLGIKKNNKRGTINRAIVR
jgi:hypothetical protein